MGGKHSPLFLCMSMEEHFEPAETCMVLVARPTWPPIYRSHTTGKEKGPTLPGKHHRKEHFNSREMSADGKDKNT